MRSPHPIVSMILSLALTGCSSVTQQADLSFKPTIPHPAYPEGRGLVVQIDASGNSNLEITRDADLANHPVTGGRDAPSRQQAEIADRGLGFQARSGARQSTLIR